MAFLPNNSYTKKQLLIEGRRPRGRLPPVSDSILSNSHAWGLDDGSERQVAIDLNKPKDSYPQPVVHRERYTKALHKKIETVPMGARLPAYMMERIAEIVGQRYIPECKTVTDVIWDAVALWLEDYDAYGPDGHNGSARILWEMERYALERDQRERAVASIRDALDDCAHDGHSEGIERILVHALKLQQQLVDGDATTKQRQELDQQIKRAKRMAAGDGLND